METPDAPPVPNSPQKAGCQQEPCSPSLVAPETREEWRRLQRLPDGSYSSQVTYGDLAHGMSAFAKKMECDRDRLLKALLRIEEIYIDGCDTYEDWKAMGTIAREALSENA